MESSVSPGSGRKRPRDDETASQRNKREKAAERQRRKRERDRNPEGPYLPHSASIPQQPPQAPPTQMSGVTTSQPPHEQLAEYVSQQQQRQQHQSQQQQHDLTPDELERREKVRAAARERQRKHRRLVKDRKMRELGLDMGNEVVPGLEDVHYRPPGPEGIFHLPQDLQQQHATAHAAAAAMNVGAGPNVGEPPFPQGQPHGGQTFATTILLSFSCAPLLKQHLLRTLNMTNEELASLEPIIADAWDQWDAQRRLHYDPQHNANGVFEGGTMNGGPPPFPPPPVAASPFQPAAAAASTNGPSSSTPSSSGSAHEAIDPHLGGGESVSSGSTKRE